MAPTLTIEPTTEEAPAATHPTDRFVTEMAELAGGLAHELRNPLSTIIIQLKLLSEDLKDPSVDQENMRRRALLKVDTVRREVERLEDVFEEFLCLTGPCRLRLDEVDVSTIVRRLAEFIEPAARQAGIRIECVVPPEPVLQPVDERLIGQALLNLVVNAQQAMPGGGLVRLDLQDEPETIVLSVADTGVGIPPKDRDKIFRPFYSTKPRGTGLGLSITRRIARKHGGELTFETEAGMGTTFTLRLPKKSDALERSKHAGT
jgi:two-component system sensor histidine kinase HydH